MSNPKNEETKEGFKMPRRLSDWVLSGLSITVVVGSLIIIGRYGEKVDQLEKLMAREEIARTESDKELKKAMTELAKNQNEMVVAQKVTNQRLESIDKSTASIKDMKEVFILWQSQIQRSQYIHPQSYRNADKGTKQYKMAYK